MSSFIDAFIEGLIETTLIEWVAVLSGIAYVILASLRSIFCWFFALISSALYIYICISAEIYVESSLQFFYFLMAIFGWVSWNKNKVKDTIDIIRWPYRYHIFNILISTLLTLITGYMFLHYTDQKNPFLDAATTVFSLAATYMVVRRVLENWIYWIFIDIFSIALYTNRSLYLTGVLYFIYTLIAIFGLYQWYRQYKVQHV